MRGDAYTFDRPRSVSARRERATGEGEDVRLARQRRDGELRRLEVLAAHREGRVLPRELEPWEAARLALDREGSYRELRVALVLLRRRSAYDFAAVRCVYGTDSELRTVGPDLQRRADEAVRWLADRMPAEIRVPEWALADPLERKGTLWRRRVPAARKGRRDRDLEVRRAREAGASPVELAPRFGLSERQVRRILAAGDGEEAISA